MENTERHGHNQLAASQPGFLVIQSGSVLNLDEATTPLDALYNRVQLNDRMVVRDRPQQPDCYRIVAAWNSEHAIAFDLLRSFRILRQ